MPQVDRCILHNWYCCIICKLKWKRVERNCKSSCLPQCSVCGNDATEILKSNYIHLQRIQKYNVRAGAKKEQSGQQVTTRTAGPSFATTLHM